MTLLPGMGPGGVKWLPGSGELEGANLLISALTGRRVIIKSKIRGKSKYAFTCMVREQFLESC